MKKILSLLCICLFMLLSAGEKPLLKILSLFRLPMFHLSVESEYSQKGFRKVQLMNINKASRYSFCCSSLVIILTVQKPPKI